MSFGLHYARSLFKWNIGENQAKDHLRSQPIDMGALCVRHW
jgi:hypothetical protein